MFETEENYEEINNSNNEDTSRYSEVTILIHIKILISLPNLLHLLLSAYVVP